MEIEGFPELERCWREFVASGASLESLTHEQIEAERRAHTEPLFGQPAASAAAVLASTAAVSSVMLPAVRDLTAELPTPARSAVEAGYELNVGLLVFAGAVAVQRYLIHPFGRLMGRDAACMLRAHDFRREMLSTQRFAQHDGQLLSFGIGLSWDSPEYHRSYRMVAGEALQVVRESSEQLILRGLRALIGSKDTELRKHVPGNLTPNLKKGKGSVTEIVKEFGPQIALAKTNQLPAREAIELFRAIAERHCAPNSLAQREISSWITQLESPDTRPPHGSVHVQPWARDPWVDLTSQKEFFSSASLRSRSIMESGSKGRLGTFGYLRNPSISCLDFANEHGRAVRARLVAGTIRTKDGPRTAMFVDGVEGSNSIAPELVCAALQDYARECGFEFLAVNTVVHNRTPKGFVNHLFKKGLTAGEVNFAAFDHSTREYLDAFGLPLQPFEYAHPAGPVQVMLLALKKDKQEVELQETLKGRLKRWAQRNALHALYLNGVGFAVLVSSQVSWALATGLAAAGTAGLIANRRYQQRSRQQAV
jgi:hypothetical protein